VRLPHLLTLPSPPPQVYLPQRRGWFTLTYKVSASYTSRMETIRYVPTREEDMKTYLFQAEIEQDDDGRWSAWIEALPGCAVWGYTKEEALEALKDAA
jgi:hypothetical protein